MPPANPLDTGVRTAAGLGRRRFLGAIGSTGLAVLAGCTGRAEQPIETPEPVSLAGGKQDDQGGMIIGEHFGPNGQIFYRDHEPAGHANPAWFHTLAHGLFPYYFEHERLGWEALAVYVTDYSRVDYTLADAGGQTFISSHVEPETFAAASAMQYVSGSDVHGGMGPELIPFGEPDDAQSFRSEHGGSLVAFDDITEEKLQHLSHDHEH